MTTSDYVGRYAPSPTGPLHLGNALAAVVAWRRARAASGRFIVRIEDLDTPRCLPGMAAEQLDDLRWLGLDWDGEPETQSSRLSLYSSALDALRADGHVYFCTCSRKDIAARVASAPHGAADDGPVYPGTCRERRDAPPGRASVRFLVPDGVVGFDDALCGAHSQDVARQVGDFVLARADGVFAYQLAAVVDDKEMGITEVVRGGDLLHSTPRQILLHRALGNPRVPSFAHTPMLIASSDGAKLSKREPRHTLRGLRDSGVSGARLRDALLALPLDVPTVSVAQLGLDA